MHLTKRHRTTCRKQNGATLIEVLVTVIVLAIGLLGLARLQASGTKFNHAAYLRSQATNLAYDMADRMRANLGGNYTTVRTDVFTSATGPECSQVLGAVTAARDVNQWKHCLETTLPLGRGAVTRLAAGGSNYVDACGTSYPPAADRDLFIIEVTWDNSRLQNEAAAACVVIKTEVAPL